MTEQGIETARTSLQVSAGERADHVAAFTRPLHLCKQIVILDGLTGTGKTMFSPLMSSFDRIQNARFEYMVEYLCIAAGDGKMTADAATSLLNLLADIKCYDGTISREVNFRPTDLSSVFNSSKATTYLRQLLMPDGERAGVRLERDNPILLFVTHQILSRIQVAIDAFGDRLQVVQMVRHPLYLLDHWDSYIGMHGTSPRDFTVWLDFRGQAVPWFASGWEARYVGASRFDQVIYAIDSLMQHVFVWAEREDASKTIAFVPFEQFVLEPEAHVAHVEQLLGTRRTAATAKVLRAQQVPRPSINAGPQKSIYKRYGLKKHDKTVTPAEDYERLLADARGRASPDAFMVLTRCANRYETTFGRWF